MMRWPSRQRGAPEATDPEGHRIIGLSEATGEAIIAPKGHSLTYGSSGSGKTRKMALPALFSLAASEPHKAILFLDSKDGEAAIQTARMFAEMGRKVAIMDDMGVWTSLEAYQVALNPFGPLVTTRARDPRDCVFASEMITHALIEEPENDQKNKYFRAWPRNILEFGSGVLLKRAPATATPGGTSVIVSDPDMLQCMAEIEVTDGDPVLEQQAQAMLKMMDHEHWPQHLEEAQRALRLFSVGTRLHEVGRDTTLTHADLIREGYIIFLVGPQAYMTRLGAYYALHIMGFCDALYHGAGSLRIIANEFTNCPLQPMVDAITTLRSFGGELHLIAQSPSEVERKFGEKQSRTLDENCICKHWLGFSSYDVAERISKAMGEQHAVASSLGDQGRGQQISTNLSLTKQRHMSAAELMSMDPDHQLNWIKGIGYFVSRSLSQENFAPYCDFLAPNPMEGGRLTPDPKITLVTPERVRDAEGRT